MNSRALSTADLLTLRRIRDAILNNESSIAELHRLRIHGVTTGYLPYSSSATGWEESNAFYDATNSRLGIGTTTPTQQLSLSQSMSLVDTTASNLGVIYKDANSFIHNYHNLVGAGAVPDGCNLFIGINAGNFTTGSTATSTNHGSYNTGIGESSLASVTTGFRNFAAGLKSMYSLTTARDCIAIGMESLYTDLSGIYNCAIGYRSLYLATGNYNTGISVLTLPNLGTGDANCAISATALYTLTNGSYNTAIGYASLYSLNTNSYNTAIGPWTLYSLNNGNYNFGAGYRVLYSATTAGYNCGSGSQSLYLLDTGNYNTSYGTLSMYNLTSGSYNVAVGASAGRYISGAGNNALCNNSIFIGSGAAASANNETNQIVIGYNAVGIGSNTTVIGNSSTVTARIYGDIQIDSDTDMIIFGDGQDSGIYDNGSNMLFDCDLLSAGSRNFIFNNGFLRRDTASYRRYYHLPISSFDPGASGATWTSADANHLSGWQLNAAGEILEFDSDVHADWDGASDIIVEISFQLLDAGAPNDTVDLRLVAYYMGNGDTATKSQTVEVPTTTDGTQYKMYTAEFTLDYDAVSNVIDVGDKISLELNLETDTSEIDNILIVNGSMHYNTTHVGIESGDT